MNRYKFIVLIILVLLMFLVSCNGGEPLPKPEGSYTLTILHNNDGESKLLDSGGDLGNYGGMAQFAKVVEWERNYISSYNAGNGNSDVIMVSSGDNFLAGREFAAHQLGGKYYDAIALDLLNYDAICLGNHDFDFGPEVLAEFIKQVSDSQATFLSANLDFSGESSLRYLVDEGRIAKSVILDEKKEKIGIIGATTPDLDIISTPKKVKVIKDVAKSVQAEIDRLVGLGTKIIVLLSHMQNFNEDLALLSQLQGIDVMVSGGDDLVLANEPCDLLIPGDNIYAPYPYFVTDLNKRPVPVVTTGGQYSYLGKLVVTFDDNGEYVDIDRYASLPIRVASSDNLKKVRDEWLECKKYEVTFRSELEIKITENVIDPMLADINLQGARTVANSQVALDGRESEIRSRSTNLGDLVADALLWQAEQLAPHFTAPLPDLAIINGGAIRNDSVIPIGEIRLSDTIDIAPFANFVTVVEGITREQFKEILENSVSKISEKVTDLDGRFAQVSGFRFEWSASGTAQVINPDDGSIIIPGTRIQKVVLDNGEVIVGGGNVLPGDPLIVATTDWQARGGDEYPFRGAPFYPLGISYQQALANYLDFTDGLNGTIRINDYSDGDAPRIKKLP